MGTFFDWIIGSKMFGGTFVSDQYGIIEIKFALQSETAPTKGKDKLYERTVFKTPDVRQ